MKRKTHVTYTDEGTEVTYTYQISKKQSNSFTIADIKKDGQPVSDIIVEWSDTKEHTTFTCEGGPEDVLLKDENSTLMKFCRLVLAEEWEE